MVASDFFLLFINHKGRFVTVDGYETYYGDCVATVTGLDADRLGYFDIEDEITKLGYENWDGKERVAKEIIEAIDEEKKSVTFKVIGGDLMELYKSFKLTVHVDANGNNMNMVTWTLDYEKKNENVPNPHSLMDFCLKCPSLCLSAPTSSKPASRTTPLPSVITSRHFSSTAANKALFSRTRIPMDCTPARFRLSSDTIAAAFLSHLASFGYQQIAVRHPAAKTV
ncbi:polyketide cyclase/dehydrase and lipid transportsuperfamily protein [Striga asiatica]|uniref:Polyketide cyclase/dehydrase and lipid transportsuperfamily protein n=1 Tax=Striga asiatica TaxID=4170 RepID=A0A5A7PWV1_STRAF|nr:polyketide cyclase/dehydrase and lipid transportsuperfamily protein [Striga asiatica]